MKCEAHGKEMPHGVADKSGLAYICDNNNLPGAIRNVDKIQHQPQPNTYRLIANIGEMSKGEGYTEM